MEPPVIRRGRGRPPKGAPEATLKLTATTPRESTEATPPKVSLTEFSSKLNSTVGQYTMSTMSHPLSTVTANDFPATFSAQASLHDDASFPGIRSIAIIPSVVKSAPEPRDDPTPRGSFQTQPASTTKSKPRKKIQEVAIFPNARKHSDRVLIIGADVSDVAVRIRVQRSKLAEASSTFNDMLDPGSKYMDNVVQLPNDDPKSMEILLRIAHGYANTVDTDQINPSLMARCIRLASKYELSDCVLPLFQPFISKFHYQYERADAIDCLLIAQTYHHKRMFTNAVCSLVYFGCEPQDGRAWLMHELHGSGIEFHKSLVPDGIWEVVLFYQKEFKRILYDLPEHICRRIAADPGDFGDCHCGISSDQYLRCLEFLLEGAKRSHTGDYEEMQRASLMPVWKYGAILNSQFRHRLEWLRTKSPMHRFCLRFDVNEVFSEMTRVLRKRVCEDLEGMDDMFAGKGFVPAEKLMTIANDIYGLGNCIDFNKDWVGQALVHDRDNEVAFLKGFKESGADLADVDVDDLDAE